MLSLVGVNHKTAALAIRETVAFPKQDVGEAARRLREATGAREAVILSTCNRVELYGVGARPACLLRFLAEDRGVRLPEIAGCAYQLTGTDAARHGLRVAASLDSMVVGEAQIAGQVRAAFSAANAAGTLGPVLSELRKRAAAAARRARSETALGRHAVSVSHVAVELARKIFGSLAARRVLLIGAGKMSELAARRLVEAGAHATVLGGRTFERAAGLARALGGRAAAFETLRAELAAADVVVSGTGAPGVVVTANDVAAARSARSRPLFVIDIAVPRDVDPAVRALPGVFLYDVDDLQAVARANLAERMRHAEGAESVVEQELEAFLAWARAREAVPAVVALRERGEAVRRAELQKARGRLAALTSDQRAAVEAVTRAIVNKVLHAPTVGLKDLARGGDAGDVARALSLLGLAAAPLAAAGPIVAE
jgi:glutamyl-tRNA reductase